MAIWDKVYYVGARAESAGRFEAKIFINYWYSHPEADKNGDGILQFVIIKGEPGHQDTELRTEYLMRTLAESGIVLDRLDEDTALWERERAEGEKLRMGRVYQALGLSGGAFLVILLL